MTYWEKWRVDIENIGVQFNGKKTEDINQAATIIAVGKDGTPRMCRRDCADCIFKSSIGDISCVWKAREWLEDEAEPDKQAPEEKEKMEKGKIKVGDTVKVTKKSCAEEGKIGLVRKLFSISADGVKTYRVRFNGTFSECVFFENELEKVKTKKTPPRIVIYQDGDTVTARDLETGEEASAVCSKKDIFDFHTGAFIAISRLTGFDTEIRRMRIELEQIESYISYIKMRFGALMGKGYKYPDFDEEEKAK